MAVVLSEDKCDIPGECLKKGGIPLKIAVYGVKGEERKSTGLHVTSKILFPANISVGTGGSGDPMAMKPTSRSWESSVTHRRRVLATRR